MTMMVNEALGGVRLIERLTLGVPGAGHCSRSMLKARMLIVHHLGRSQSDRVVWACEELEIPYELNLYEREPSGAAPASYKALHFFGTAPTIEDGDVVLGESGAIVEYLCRKQGKGRFTVGPDAANFAQYLYWLHFANGTFIPAVMMARASNSRLRLDRAYEMVEQRLGETQYFAGPEFTAADIMMVYPMTTARLAVPKDISGYPNILAYLQRIVARPGFKRARLKGDPGVEPHLT
jgi:glutathione S-transferase